MWQEVWCFYSSGAESILYIHPSTMEAVAVAAAAAPAACIISRMQEKRQQRAPLSTTFPRLALVL
jgi:hypothetical protein